jgi:hypothetical protein
MRFTTQAVFSVAQRERFAVLFTFAFEPLRTMRLRNALEIIEFV